MSRRIAGLDVLRGLAVALVLLRHALPDLAPGAGVVGVVMFFAISGYLITGVLVGGVLVGDGGLRAFYARRARRLVPALVAMLVVLTAVTLALDPVGDRADLPRTLLVALTWTADVPWLDHGSPVTFHLWTLAVEEQFYLLWPATLLVLGRRRGLAVAAVGTTLALLATVWWLRTTPDAAYTLPTSWAVCFVIGAAARLARDQPLAVPPWAPPVALAALGVLAVVPLRGHVLTYLAGGPAIAALTAVLLLSWHTWTEVTGPLAVPAWLGTVSYAAYLWDYPLTLWLRPHLAYAGPLAALLAVGAAALSWHLVERPWLRPRGVVRPVAA